MLNQPKRNYQTIKCLPTFSYLTALNKQNYFEDIKIWQLHIKYTT